MGGVGVAAGCHQRGICQSGQPCASVITDRLPSLLLPGHCLAQGQGSQNGTAFSADGENKVYSIPAIGSSADLPVFCQHGVQGRQPQAYRYGTG